MCKKLYSFVLALLLSVMIGFSAFADDLEIFGSSLNGPPPNVLFIMDTSGSMGAGVGGGQTRMTAVQNALIQVLQNSTDINVGLMRFHNRGGPVLYPVKPIDDTIAGLNANTTVRDELVDTINTFSPRGTTPIVDTLLEAGNYYAGALVDYGLRRGEGSVRAQTRVSARDSYIGLDPVRPAGCNDFNLSSWACADEFIPAGARYISPIDTSAQCPIKNYIVLLSDGSPVGNTSRAKIQNLIGRTCPNGSSGGWSGICGPELAEFLNTENNGFTSEPVSTFTIGFASSVNTNNYLNELANRGGGQFYTADDSASLISVFNTILTEVADNNSAFVSPGVAVDQQNRLTHLNQLYFSVFEPTDRAIWPGNLKRYRLSGGRVVDANDVNAIDPTTGFFKEEARSFWSPTTDGSDVKAGGAVSRLPNNRNVYTFGNGAGNILINSNRVREDNNNISINDLGLNSVPNNGQVRTNLLRWTRGIDVLDADGDGSTTDLNPMMGDPIHSTPVLVTHSDSVSSVYVATNQGFLHSINTDNGVENWSIIPRDLLGNLHRIYENNVTFDHVYGLDGDIVVRNHDNKVWLYVGMRRGGKNYYVIDVTQPQSPKFVYKINGGTGAFGKLGQTWSRPIFTKVNIGGTLKDVMVFGGGYDESQDDKVTRSPDSVGNSIFIVDADNGNLLWSASNNNATLSIPQMRYSIPARIAVIDRDFDGQMDHMYAADTGGQIFRFDVYKGRNTNNLIKGGRIASLGGNNAANNRRFYYAPDVSEVVRDNNLFYSVAIGSGFRAGPLNTQIQDEFYMIKDEGVFQKDADGHYSFPATPIRRVDLYNATSHELTSTDAGVRNIAETDFANKKGWLIRLNGSGEKSLASPVIFNNKVFFTTYIPYAESANRGPCDPVGIGSSKAYLVNLENANAVTDLNNNGRDDANDRSANLEQTGIPPSPSILIESPVDPVVCIGTECAKAVVTEDANGNIQACASELECLAQTLFGQSERVNKETWNTEVENQ